MNYFFLIKRIRLIRFILKLLIILPYYELTSDYPLEKRTKKKEVN